MLSAGIASYLYHNEFIKHPLFIKRDFSIFLQTFCMTRNSKKIVSSQETSDDSVKHSKHEQILTSKCSNNVFECISPLSNSSDSDSSTCYSTEVINDPGGSDVNGNEYNCPFTSWLPDINLPVFKK